MRVSTDKEHLSLPRLYGNAPQTSRRMAVVPSEPPLGPDDLPIENYRSPEDSALAHQLFPRSYNGLGTDASALVRPTEMATDRPLLWGRPTQLRALAGRLLRPRDN